MGLSLLMIIAIITMGIVYCKGQHTEERILECVKAGRSPTECRAALENR